MPDPPWRFENLLTPTRVLGSRPATRSVTMTSRRMQILLPVLLLTGVVPTLAAQAPAPPAPKTQTPTTAPGPRVSSDWRSYEPQLPRDRSAADASALPKARTVTVETWVIIVAAVVLILILV